MIEWGPCSVCGAKTPVVTVHMPKGTSQLQWAKHVDNQPFYEDKPFGNSNALILGSYLESGKTVQLFNFIGYFHSGALHHKDRICASRYGKGSTVLYRALTHSFEYLSLLDAGVKLNLILPENCEYKFDHPNLVRSTHSLGDYEKLFSRIRRDCVNIIAAGHFLLEPDQYYNWWGWFHERLLDWKIRHALNSRYLYAIDEVGDLVPSRFEAEYPVHGRWGNRIRKNFDNFRRCNIKVIVTTHTIRDIKKRFRAQFPWWFIKKSHPETVPDEYKRYAKEIERLQVWECFMRDAQGRFNIRPTPLWVETRNFSILTTPAPEMAVEGELGSAETTKLRARLAAALHELHAKGYGYRDLARVCRWGSQARPYDLLRMHPSSRLDQILGKPLEEATPVKESDEAEEEEG